MTSISKSGKVPDGQLEARFQMGGRAAKMQRDGSWNQCQEPRVTCNLIALRMASSDVEGSRRKVRRAAEMRRDKRWNRLGCREPRVSCDLRASRLAVHDVDGRQRMAGRVANMRGDECEKPMSGTACVVRL